MKTGKRLVVARNLPAEKVIKPEDIAIKSPGDGLVPYELDEVVGQTTLCELKTDGDISFEVLNGAEFEMAVAGQNPDSEMPS